MNTVSYTTSINMPTHQAWELLKDLSVPHNYVPGVTRTEITTSQREGEGASRLVYLMGVIPMRETVTQWQQGSGFTIALALKNAPFPPPMKAGFFDYQIKSENGETVITNSLSFELSWNWLSKSVGFISRPIVKVILWKITNNMKKYYLSTQAIPA